MLRRYYIYRRTRSDQRRETMPKRNRYYWTKGTPACGGFPGVSPERIKILRRAHGVTGIASDLWFIVRYDDGGRICMHASNIGAEVAQ